ncbi:MAG: tetratricopeptide repeat protein [Planctomycetes bacterium]|nr:tetratricopeptide repeat protein [Planctomycetota bacterium]MCB9911989.1 tetratricopeptide repeat protein [Planctomycetota bacterium]HPF12930.1 tetratricopeptide repeat protein [Planctomycetota bacterium]
MSIHVEHYKEGMTAYGKGDNPAAIAAFQKALDAKPEWTEAMHGLALACLHDGQVDRAIEVGLAIAEIDKGDPFVHTSLSIFYQRKSQVAEKAGDEPEAKKYIKLAEEEGAKARLLSWKIELKTNPNAAPPGPADGMRVID